MSNDKSSLKRKNESSSDNNTTATKKPRSRLDMSQGPKIPVRSTLASRSNANSPTNRLSNASTSTIIPVNKRPSDIGVFKRLSNTSTSSATTSKRISSASTSSISSKGVSTVSTSFHATANDNTKNPITNYTTTKRTPLTKRPTLTKPVKKVSPPAEKPALAAARKKSSAATLPPGLPPAGDLKARIKFLESSIDASVGQVQTSEIARSEIESNLQSTESQLQEAIKKVADLTDTKMATEQRHQEEINKIKEKHHAKIAQHKSENDRYKAQMNGRDVELKNLQNQYQDGSTTLELERRDSATLKITKERITASYAEVDANVKDHEMKLKSAGNELEDNENRIRELDNQAEQLMENSQEMTRRLLEEEKNRRKLHNTIQELKGNIRVFCRVRPSLGESEQDLADIKFIGEEQEKMELTEQVSSTLGRTSSRVHAFQFDRVFSPAATQKDCFEEISQLVQSALDGFNVCIFAYGQTGSGKTFTMQGASSPTEETVGMIPRAVQQIYHVAQQLKQFGWQYTMEGQFLEIYNESIHDLLGDASNYGKIKHEIHHGNSGQTTVSDMTSVTLDSPTKVKSMLRKASQNRATGATNLNERSSRSHSVFTLKLSGHNEETGEKTLGILNLIDLAGSERLSSSGSVGDRLRETQAINKSLACLGDVIQALINNKEGGHIPYRNSKLTWLLRNSLGGNCKTLMFVNVSPMMEHFGESLCSLRFATKVNSCQVGTANKKSTK